MNRHLSEKEAAQALGVSRITLLRMRKRGAISYYRIGSRVLYSDQHILEFLERHESRRASG